MLSVADTDSNTLTYRVQLSNMSTGRKTEPVVTGNAYESLTARFRKAANLLQLSDTFINELEAPAEEISFLFTVEMDNGNTETFTGYYVIHSTLAGPAKGGLYYATDTEEDTTRFLAGCITWKAALAGIPFGGAKGGIVCDTARLSKTEKERVTIAYINALTANIHTRNNTAGNVLNNAPVTDWLLDEFSLQHGASLHAVVSGKCTPNDSNSVRAQATGKGISQVTLLALEAKKKRPKKSSAAIQGFGNVGMHTALYLWEKGVKIVAVSDADTALFNPEGFHIPDLIAYSESNGNSLYGYYDAYEILQGELLTLPVDVLIPAATQHVITAGNAAAIKAPVIVEAANGPIHAEADVILQRKNTFVIPDLLANAGGIIVSYLEWLQNTLHQPWSTEQIFQRMEAILHKNFTDIVETADQIRDTLRTAAWLLAVKRLTDTATVNTAIAPALQPAYSQKN